VTGTSAGTSARPEGAPEGAPGGTSGPTAAPGASAAAEPLPRPIRLAGRALVWGSVVPVLLVAAWLVVTLPLLLAGQLWPLPAVGLWLPVAAGLLVAVLPRLHVDRLAAASGVTVNAAGRGVWPVAATVAVAVGFGVLAALTHSEHVLVRRDPGAYAQTGFWLAQHGRLPIPMHLGAFGGPDAALVVGSPAFYADGGVAVPQFMSGMPLLLAAGQWLGGWTASLLVPAVLGALALLVVGGLAARLIGVRWAPLAALLTGLAQPVLHAARSTYSEPLALLVLLGGVYLLVAALEGNGAGPRRAVPAAAGLVLGLSLLVRIDAVVELTLLLPLVGWLYLRRRREASPLLAGLLVGAGLGAVDGAVLSRPYLRDIAGSLRPAIVLCVATAVLTAAVVAGLALLRRRRGRGIELPGLVGRLAPVGVLAVGLMLTARPLVQTVRAAPGPGPDYVGSLQRASRIAVDPTRLYSEHSVHWLAWYLGWPLLALALGAAALLTGALLAPRRLRGWGLHPELVDPWRVVLPLGLGATVLALWRPGITPDHPWADRRFVPLVIPVLVLLAVYLLAVLAHSSALARLGARRGTAVLACGVVLVGVPVPAASARLLGARTEVGEVAAMHRACAAFGPRDVVIFVDPRGKNEWTQVLRGVCGVPTAWAPDADRATVARLARRAEAAGSSPVFAVGDVPAPLVALGLTPRPVVEQATRQDQQLLTSRPERTNRLTILLWIAAPSRAG
jgi:hypothetical protein